MPDDFNFNIPDDLGFLAEDACRQLASAIVQAKPGSPGGLLTALRRFMWEAKGKPAQP